jgi:hypothetical protein
MPPFPRERIFSILKLKIVVFYKALRLLCLLCLG